MRFVMRSGSGGLDGWSDTPCIGQADAFAEMGRLREVTARQDELPGLVFNIPEEVIRDLKRNPERVYVPDENRLQANRRCWQHTLYGKFLGPRIQIHYLRRRLAQMWPVQNPYFVGDLANGFYFFKFSTEEDLMADHLLSLQRWRNNFDPSIASFELTPIWVRFPNLPLDFWDGLTLAEIAAYAGTPIKVETTTEETGHCRYARALVEIDLRLPLCPGIWIGAERRWQSFIYERIPNVCQHCGRITHLTTECIDKSLGRVSASSKSQVGPSVDPVGHDGSSAQEESPRSNPSEVDKEEGQWKIVPPHRRPNAKNATEHGSVIAKREQSLSDHSKGKTVVSSKSAVGTSVEQVPSNELILVKEAVSRASRKRTLEEDVNPIPERPQLANTQSQESTSRALALFQRSWPDGGEKLYKHVSKSHNAESLQMDLDTTTVVGPPTVKDKRGGAPFRSTPEVLEFRWWKDNNGLCPLISKGPKYTWCNNRLGNTRTWELLDRAFANSAWISQFPSATIEVLSRSYSDHAPLLLNTELLPPAGRKPFRFERFWFAYPELYEIVDRNWTSWSQGSPMGRLQNKLRHLQEPLRQWNRRVIGDLPSRVAQAHAQGQLETFWAQRARLQWVLEGDRNSKFFHAKVQRRRLRNRIDEIQTLQGHRIGSPEEIRRYAKDYFSDHWASKMDQLNEIPQDILPQRISPDMEIMHSLRIRKGRHALVAAKIDLAAAYDSVDTATPTQCKEIRQVMEEARGFTGLTVNWQRVLLDSPHRSRYAY
ncbi:hypothetical protein QJS10_CPA06g01100 [Acorus calamus]|uniref:DUF4283 domain-containing protein n=1 Tax=Acorus calamus TaxID=4465 RepID=A0AAV9ENR0_ACOCL|nr:hypothetical protein QJS10_CPA06g01100 [Acorus calamus]